MYDSLAGKEVILAGGSGGLGAITAELLAAEGARLLVSYLHNRSRAERLAPSATLMEADLSHRQHRASLLAAAPQLYGVVIFAGNPARVGEPDMLPGALQLSLEANFTGPILLAREAVEKMKTIGVPGSIVLFSTMQAVSLFPGSTAYGGAKAALLHAGRILARECRGAANIRVNVICPGVMAAGMAEASIASGKYDRFLKEGYIHRFGRPQDIAKAVRFLLEPDNYITGQVLIVDGGLTL